MQVNRSSSVQSKQFPQAADAGGFVIKAVHRAKMHCCVEDDDQVPPL